jgi:putative component of toxin-antitoxin plasmid stabilization module
LGHRVYIRLQPKRYECLHCAGKTTTQALDQESTHQVVRSLSDVAIDQ